MASLPERSTRVPIPDDLHTRSRHGTGSSLLAARRILGELSVELQVAEHTSSAAPSGYTR